MWLAGVTLIQTNWLKEFEVFGNSFYFDTALMYIFLFGVFHAYEYFNLFKQHEASERELLKLSFESEKSILNAQMQPHFLFNILNSINASIPFQLENTRESVAMLAQTYRFILNASKIESVSVKEELFFFKEYLRLENERFENILTFDFNTDISVLKRKCPPMSLHATLYHLIEYLRVQNIAEINFNMHISSLAQVLKFEVSIYLSEGLSKGNFLELSELKASSKPNKYFQQYILSQISENELFIMFLLNN